MWTPPFIRFALFLIFGIIFARFNPIDLNRASWAYLCSSVFIFLFCLFFLQKKRKAKSYILLGGLTLLGFSRYVLEQEINATDHLFHEEKPILSYTIKLHRFQKENERFKIYLADVLAYQNHQQQRKPSKGIVQVYFYQTDSLTQQLSIGDVLYIKGHPQKITGQNTYAHFLRNQHIYFEDFISENSWAFLQKNKTPTWNALVSDLRTNIEAQVRKVFVRPNQQQLAFALLLGNKSGLNPDIKTSFITSGLAHILAVSGLHVALILFFFLWIFRSWEKANAPIRFLCFTFLMCILWGYATLTAFSPSVVRASLMLSIWLLGKAFQKPTDGFNTVGISAFIQLCIHPHLLFDIGFQLSYTAVLSILYFYPKWNNILHFSFLPFEKLWQAVLISFTAQLGTFPLCLYYFHQFPTYFLLSNMAVTFLIPFVLAFGFSTLFLSFITEQIASYTALVFHFLTECMLTMVAFFSRLPLASITPIHLKGHDVFFLYALIMALYFSFQKRSFFSFKVSLFSLLILLSSFSFKKIQQKQHVFCRLRYAQKSLMLAIKKEHTSPIIYKTNPTQTLTDITRHFPDLFHKQLGQIHLQDLDTMQAFYLWDFYGQKILYPHTSDALPSYCIDFLILTDQQLFSKDTFMATNPTSLEIKNVFYFGYKEQNFKKWKEAFNAFAIEVRKANIGELKLR